MLFMGKADQVVEEVASVTYWVLYDSEQLNAHQSSVFHGYDQDKMHQPNHKLNC